MHQWNKEILILACVSKSDMMCVNVEDLDMAIVTSFEIGGGSQLDGPDTICRCISSV